VLDAHLAVIARLNPKLNAIVTLVADINGRKLESYIDWIAPTFQVTLVSLPAGSVPAGLTRDGLPVGLQIVAPRFEEPRILSVAKVVQQMNPIGWPGAAGR
jgi:amidase